MTLKQWSEKYNRLVHYKPSGLVHLVTTYNNEENRELHHLDDYVVTTITAGSTFLVPRKNMKAKLHGKVLELTKDNKCPICGKKVIYLGHCISKHEE